MSYNKLWLCVTTNKICSAKILVKLKPIAAIFNWHAITCMYVPGTVHKHYCKIKCFKIHVGVFYYNVD